MRCRSPTSIRSKENRDRGQADRQPHAVAQRSSRPYIGVRPDGRPTARTSHPGDLAASSTTSRPRTNILALQLQRHPLEPLFVEAQYSQRTFTIEGSGSPYTDFVRGTRRSTTSARASRYNTPAGYAGSPKSYDDTSWLAKASYLLATENLGTHDLRGGYEWFREADACELRLLGKRLRRVPGHGRRSSVERRRLSRVAERRTRNSSRVAADLPALARATDFLTQSVFVNDRSESGRAPGASTWDCATTTTTAGTAAGQVVSDERAPGARASAAQFDRHRARAASF